MLIKYYRLRTCKPGCPCVVHCARAVHPHAAPIFSIALNANLLSARARAHARHGHLFVDLFELTTIYRQDWCVSNRVSTEMHFKVREKFHCASSRSQTLVETLVSTKLSVRVCLEI